MSDAGQIFSLLRSASAAELAKRFNGFASEGSVVPGAPGPGPVEPEPLPVVPGTPNSAQPGKAGPGPATAPLGATPLPGSVDAGAEAGEPDPTLPTGGGPLRSALSLGHLAPARADLARQFADRLMSGLPRPPGTAGLGGGLLAGNAAALVASGGLASEAPATAAAATADGGEVADQRSSTAGPAPGGVSGAAVGTEGLRAGSEAAAGAGRKAETGVEANELGLKTAMTDLAHALTEMRGAAASGKNVSPAQVAVFAESMAAMLGKADAAPQASVASGIIFNAAMMPGWPFPSAMAREGGGAINPKAMLHQLATALEGMTPQQAAEYMAKIGGGHVLLRKLRQLLKELDLTRKDEVKGLLMAFLETLSTIATGIQTALKQLTESAALQSAVIHGEDPEDGDRPGRRRLRL